MIYLYSNKRIINLKDNYEIYSGFYEDIILDIIEQRNETAYIIEDSIAFVSEESSYGISYEVQVVFESDIDNYIYKIFNISPDKSYFEEKGFATGYNKNLTEFFNFYKILTNAENF